MLANQVYKWFILIQLVSKREIELLMTKCFLCVATTSLQFDWDHLHYAKHITVSYCIQQPPDLVITLNCHSMLLCFTSYWIFPTSTISTIFPLLFMFLVLSGDLFNNGQGPSFFIKTLKNINHFTFVCRRGGGKGRKLCMKMIKLGLFELIIGIIKLSVHLKEKFRSIICTHCMFLFF